MRCEPGGSEEQEGGQGPRSRERRQTGERQGWRGLSCGWGSSTGGVLSEQL